MTTIGFLHNASFTDTRVELSAFWQGMEQVGFGEHRNVAAEYRWADGRDELLPSLAMDLVDRNVDVLVAGGDNCVTAAKQATGRIPIVFVSGSDPVRSGFVASLDHPGGNVTGVSVAVPELLASRFEILHELAPQVATVAALVNPGNPNIAVQLQYLTDAAIRIGTR
jgi:ABC-type uncharacterized transport system substrate-binding protein